MPNKLDEILAKLPPEQQEKVKAQVESIKANNNLVSSGQDASEILPYDGYKPQSNNSGEFENQRGLSLKQQEFEGMEEIAKAKTDLVSGGQEVNDTLSYDGPLGKVINGKNKPQEAKGKDTGRSF
jgi:hypothetical protein